MKTNISWPPTVPAISIVLLDIASGAVGYSQLMAGDLQKPGGPSGYFMDDGPVITRDTLALIAHCTHNCSDYSQKLYPLRVSGLSVDYPRSTVIRSVRPAQPTPKHYVALGDSYSSGQGAGYYDEGTAVPGTNTCYRSVGAYSRMLSRNPYSPLQLDTFVACGGARATHITNRWNENPPINTAEQPQIAALSSATKVVTLTIGGNDIGFGTFVQGCFIDCTAAARVANGKVSALLGPALDSAYRSILAKASTAQVYVVGYPPLLSANSSLCIASAPFNYVEKRQLGLDLLNNLNRKIRLTVDSVRVTMPRIHYIDPVKAGSPLVGHDICSSNPYFVGVDPLERPNSFHPNQKGQLAYAMLITAHLPP